MSHVDLIRYALEAVFAIATSAAFWFFGGRALAQTTIAQYKAVVDSQKERISDLQADVQTAKESAEKAQLSLDNALAMLDVQDRRIKRLTGILAKTFAATGRDLHQLDPDSE